ncbi:MAG TPA: hypothetical protein VHD62_17325 [Opitutaceae bacterium]|nr:hypothetical protein [Opitutaceae bacterium]
MSARKLEDTQTRGGEKLGSFGKISFENFSKSSGKNIDEAGERVLFRPSQDGAPAKAEDVTNQGTRFSSGFFGKFPEKH